MISGVAAGPGLVVVGADLSGGDADVAVWTSSDGFTWARVPHDGENLGGRGDQIALDVTVGDPGLVMVGWDSSGGEIDAAVWTSVDGTRWQRTPHDEEIFGGPDWQVMNAVVAVGGLGLVAVGEDRSAHTGAVWISSDGHSWVRVDDEALDGIDRLEDVIAHGPGVLAVGSTSGRTGSHGVVLVSSDGLAWQRFDSSVRARSEDMLAVVSGESGLVAVGQAWYAGGGDRPGDGDWDAVVWRTTDYTVWPKPQATGDILGGPPDDQLMSDVATGGPGYVAVGCERCHEGEADAAIWTSTDGNSWQRVPHDEQNLGGPGRQDIFAVFVGGPGLVAVGLDTSGGDIDAAVWVTSTSAG